VSVNPTSGEDHGKVFCRLAAERSSLRVGLSLSDLFGGILAALWKLGLLAGVSATWIRDVGAQLVDVAAVFKDIVAIVSSTSATGAVENMRRVLSESGNRDFTLRLFPNAEHSLAEMPSKGSMAPGVFETLPSWLLQRVQIAPVPALK
jgi:hypothetical protein